MPLAPNVPWDMGIGSQRIGQLPILVAVPFLLCGGHCRQDQYPLVFLDGFCVRCLHQNALRNRVLYVYTAPRQRYASVLPTPAFSGHPAECAIPDTELPRQKLVHMSGSAAATWFSRHTDLELCALGLTGKLHFVVCGYLKAPRPPPPATLPQKMTRAASYRPLPAPPQPPNLDAAGQLSQNNRTSPGWGRRPRHSG